jgi:hypothetical protein
VSTNSRAHALPFYIARRTMGPTNNSWLAPRSGREKRASGLSPVTAERPIGVNLTISARFFQE